MSVDPTLALTATLLLATIFAAAAATKLRALDQFAGVVENYALLPAPLLRPVVLLLPAVELVAAAGLLVPATRPYAAAVLLFLLLLFAAAMAINLRRGLIVDAIATLSSGLAGTSPGTAYVESAAGIEAGARTGRASVVTALCFLPCLFLAPIAAMVPPFATAPVLILVGALMFRVVGRIEMATLEDAIPVFLTVVLIPLTFSITEGMLWGFLTHVILYALAGRQREVRPAMYAIAALSAGILALQAYS